MPSQRTEESREFPCWCSVCRKLSQASATQYRSNVDAGGNFPKYLKLQHKFHLKSEGFVHAAARDSSGNCASAMTDTSRAVLSLWGGCKKSGPCSRRGWQGRGAETTCQQDNDAAQSQSSPLCVTQLIARISLTSQFFYYLSQQQWFPLEMGSSRIFARSQCLVHPISLFREILRDARRSRCQKRIISQRSTCFIKPVIGIKVQQFSCLIAAFL